MPYADIEKRREVSRRHYAANRAAYKARAVAHNSAARRARYGEIAAYKAERGCVDCNEKDPVVLDFDHRDRSTKHFNVGDAVRKNLGRARLFAEIEKCDIRCANCHRRMEHLRRMKLRGTQ